jgi:hypothetical protein
LVVVLAVVGLLAKSQLSAVRAPAVEMPGASAVTAGPASAPAGNVREQSRQMQDQVRQQMEGLMQQARPMPEGEK